MAKQSATHVIRTLLAAVSVLFVSSSCVAQLRIVSYDTSGGPRDGLSTVLEAIGQEDVNAIVRPIDVLLVQEQVSVETDTMLMATLLNQLHSTDVYRAGVLNGDSTGDGRPGVIYRSDVVQLRSESTVGESSTDGQPRQTLRYDFGLVGYPSDATIHIYNSHYKGGSTNQDAARRLVEAEAIRADADALGPAAIIYAGNFNIQTSRDAMYQRLLAGGPGQAFDPIDSPGTWRDDASFKRWHTQSPVNERRRYPGQTLGGMDDRFDFQLVSTELLDSEGLDYIAGTYRVFGNNGSHPLNSEIIKGDGADPEVLEALAAASDHLPVVVDYQLPAKMQVEVFIPQVIAFNRASNDWLVAVTNDGPNARAIDELDYQISFLDESLVVTDVEAASRVEHPIPLEYRRLGTHSLQVSVMARSPLTANPTFAETISYMVALPGDANLDGLFNSGDLVSVFTAGEYEDEVVGNSTWATGDWDTDLDFTTSDLVLALQSGSYEQPRQLRANTVPEPSGIRHLIPALLTVACFRRRQPIS